MGAGRDLVPLLKGASAARQRLLGHAARRAVRLTNRRRADARRVLLSSAHISPRSWAEVAPEGSFLAVHVGRKQPCPVPPTTRGAVHGFSRQSRSRLLKTLAKLNRQVVSRALFVTLTYPLSESVSFSLCKRHLDSFAKRLARKFARCAVIWRMELQKNGTPHFHLIVVNQRFIPHEWVRRCWSQIVFGGNGDKYIRTETKRVVSFKEALSYAAKYAAKLADDETPDTEGRVWGIYGRRNLPIRVLQWELDAVGETRLARAIFNMVSSRSGRTKSLEYPPRWVICEGSRGVRLVGWAARLEGYV